MPLDKGKRHQAVHGATSSPWDNAAAEPLIGATKSERVHTRTFEGCKQAALKIFEYIERFCNRARIHSATG